MSDCLNLHAITERTCLTQECSALLKSGLNEGIAKLVSALIHSAKT